MSLNSTKGIKSLLQSMCVAFHLLAALRSWAVPTWMTLLHYLTHAEPYVLNFHLWDCFWVHSGIKANRALPFGGSMECKAKRDFTNFANCAAQMAHVMQPLRYEWQRAIHCWHSDEQQSGLTILVSGVFLVQIRFLVNLLSQHISATASREMRETVALELSFHNM